MKLMELYDQIENTLTRQNVSKILEIYSRNGLFYNDLVASSRKGCQYISRSESDKFASIMFNKWKNSIVSMTKEQFEKMHSKGYYDYDFLKLRKYLLGVPDVSTNDEVDNIFYQKFNDPELEMAMDRYRWNKINDTSSWTHVKSRYLKVWQEDRIDIKHRLYLNVDSTELHAVINEFVSKCDKYKIPYYFKFGFGRDDSIVIYSSTELLTRYISIIREIKQERPELFKNENKPTILCGKIDDFIGYGGEPTVVDKNGSLYSYNSLRTDILKQVIERCTKERIQQNLNRQFYFGGKVISVRDYLIDSITEKKIDEINSYPKYSFDTKSSKFYDKIRKIINDNIDRMLVEYLNGKRGISVQLVSEINSKGLLNINNFYVENISESLVEMTSLISLVDKGYIDSVISTMKSICPKYGIDPNKFCFDTKTIEEMKEYDRKTSENQTSNVRNTDKAILDDELYNMKKSIHDVLTTLHNEYNSSNNKDKIKIEYKVFKSCYLLIISSQCEEEVREARKKIIIIMKELKDSYSNSPSNEIKIKYYAYMHVISIVDTYLTNIKKKNTLSELKQLRSNASKINSNKESVPGM